MATPSDLVMSASGSRGGAIDLQGAPEDDNEDIYLHLEDVSFTRNSAQVYMGGVLAPTSHKVLSKRGTYQKSSQQDQ